jgi:hypothetical protein
MVTPLGLTAIWTLVQLCEGLPLTYNSLHAVLTPIRYECHVDYPMLDTFPSIYHTSGEEDTEKPNKIGIRTNLATGTVLSSSFRSLRLLVSPSLSSADREPLDNSLAELEDVYTNGWQSDSDEDDD